MDMSELGKAEQLLQDSKTNGNADLSKIDTWKLIKPRIPTIGDVFKNYMIYIVFTDGLFVEAFLGEQPESEKSISRYVNLDDFLRSIGYKSLEQFAAMGLKDATKTELGEAIKKQLKNVKTVWIHKI